jgi:hypothetical protein
MEIPQLTTLIPIISAIGIAMLSAWMNITIKFAQNPAQAKQAVILILLRIIGGVANVGCLFFLVREVLSPNPLTRSSLMYIIFLSLVLFNTYLLWWIGSIFGLIYTHQVENLEVIKTLVKTIRDVFSGAGRVNKEEQ